MTRKKIMKVLKRKLLEGSKTLLKCLLLAIAATAFMVAYLGIPYLIGKHLISSIPILEEVSREKCGIYCSVATIIITVAIVEFKKLIEAAKSAIDNFFEEVDKED